MRPNFTTLVRRGAPAVLALVALSLIPVRAARATDTVFLRDEASEARAIGIERTWGRLLFDVRHASDRAGSYDLDETIVGPELRLGASGSIYHRRFLTFDLEGAVRLNRVDVSATGAPGSNETISFEDYRFHARLFPERRVGMQAFATRENAWTTSPFRRSYRLRTRAEGGSIGLRSRVIPVTISAERRRSDDDYFDTTRHIEQDQARVSVVHKAGPSRTDAFVSWRDYSIDLPAQSYETVLSWFDHSLRLGTRGEVRSQVRWFNQYGTIGRRDFGASSQTQLNLTRTLCARAAYRYNDRTATHVEGIVTPDEITQSHHGEAEVSHVLWGSLHSVLGAWFDDETTFDRGAGRATTGTLDRWWVEPELRYTRHTARGQLALEYGEFFGHEERTSTLQTRSVQNEEHVLRDGQEPQLDNPRVDVTTIVVTDETGFVVYQEGVDYLVQQIGPWVQIFRVASGSIADGQTILVDYRYTFSPNVAFDSRRTVFGAQVDVPQGVCVRYRFDRIRDTFESGDPGAILDDQTRHIASVSVRRGIGRASAEWESNRLVGQTFRARRLTAGVGTRPTRRVSLDVDGAYSETRYVQTDLTQRIWLLSSRALATLRRNTTLEASAWVRLNRRNRVEVGSNADFVGLRARLVHTVGRSRIETGATWRDSNETAFDTRRFDVYLNFIRDF